jgi:Autoinducer binding domain
MDDLIATALHAPFRSFEEATDYLETTARRAGVKHLSYWYLNVDDDGADEVLWVSTYDTAYTSDYMRNFTPLGDPAMMNFLEHDTIIDWRDWQRDDPTCQMLHAVANRHGISDYGISIGFKVPNQGTVVFSVNVDDNKRDWEDQRVTLVERFQPFAHEFHERMKPLLLSRKSGELQFAFSA